jgi:hypothetical protein
VCTAKGKAYAPLRRQRRRFPQLCEVRVQIRVLYRVALHACERVEYDDAWRLQNNRPTSELLRTV